MDIEEKLKKLHPDWSDDEIRRRRIDGFIKLYGNQVNYHNWKKKGIKPRFESWRQICIEFDIPLVWMDL